MQRMEPGQIVIVVRNRERIAKAVVPKGMVEPFEPFAANDRPMIEEMNRRILLDLDRDPGQYVISASGEVHERHRNPDQDTLVPERGSKARRWTNCLILSGLLIIALWLFSAFGILPLAVWLRQLVDWATGDEAYTVSMGFVGMSLVFGLFIFVFLVIQNVRVWLVPGGILTVRYPFLGKRATVRFGRRDHSPLVIKPGLPTVYFLEEGRMHHVQINPAGLPTALPERHIVLQAWLSSANPPSRSQVLEFVGTSSPSRRRHRRP